MNIPATFPLEITTHLQQWPLPAPFRISGCTFGNGRIRCPPQVWGAPLPLAGA